MHVTPLYCVEMAWCVICTSSFLLPSGFLILLQLFIIIYLSMKRTLDITPISLVCVFVL